MSHYQVSTTIGFNGQTEEAFNFYRSVFGGEFVADAKGVTIHRYDSMPSSPDMPELPEAEKKKIAHIELKIMDGYRLQGADHVATFGACVVGNNFAIGLFPKTREEADKLFAALSDGGEVKMPMGDQFWGDYFGACIDKFGIQWSFTISGATA